MSYVTLALNSTSIVLKASYLRQFFDCVNFFVIIVKFESYSTETIIKSTCQKKKKKI